MPAYRSLLSIKMEAGLEELEKYVSQKKLRN